MMVTRSGTSARSARQGPEFDPRSTADVTRRELGRLSHVEDRTRRGRAGEHGRRHGPTGVTPGVEAAGDLAGERLVPDAEGLADQIRSILPAVEHEHELADPGGTIQPSHEANAGRSAIESDPGMWPAAKASIDRASMSSAPAARRRSTSVRSRRGRDGTPPMSLGPRRFTSRRREK